MEQVEDIKDSTTKKATKHTSLGMIIGILVLLGVIELVAGGFLYLKFAEKEQDMDERQELLFRQAASIEFKQVTINKDKAALEALDVELTALEAELKVKEEQLKEQKNLLNTLRSSIKDTVSILEPKKIAENLLNAYLDKFASVDLSIPMPCGTSARAEYNAAKMHLEAIKAAGEEISKDNKYIAFVTGQKKLMSSEQVDCGDEINLADTDYPTQQVTTNIPVTATQSQARTQANLDEEDFEDEGDEFEEEEFEEAEDIPAEDSQEMSKVNVRVDLDSDMKRRDSAFKSLK